MPFLFVSLTSFLFQGYLKILKPTFLKLGDINIFIVLLGLLDILGRNKKYKLNKRIYLRD